MNNSVFGIIGLGVMGRSIGLNLAEKGYSISIFNRIEEGEEIVQNFLQTAISVGDISGFTDLAKFVQSIQKPRRILLMIKAGKPVDSVIEDLIPLLTEGDVIIDGGNSHYLDSNRRFSKLKDHKIHFIGSGISGGEEGARKGPSIMPGGTMESYELVAPFLEAMAAKDDNGNPCCSFIGPAGAGHFVKMVHNGIEYAEMQLIAEVFALMSESLSYEETANILEDWNRGILSSFLLDITIQILRKKEEGSYILDKILDKAANKGTGAWSSKAAFDLGSVNTMMSTAVFARYISSFKEQRKNWSKNTSHELNQSKKLAVQELKESYRFARIINHHQGFELMQMASSEYNWNLNLSEIARIWTNGCIIRSHFMKESIKTLKNYSSLFEQDVLRQWLNDVEPKLLNTIKYGMQNRIHIPALSDAYQFWIGITTERLPANLIQAQRDFFGAHTYKRIDRNPNESFHTQWT